MNLTSTKRLRGMKHETLVRKVRQLERTYEIGTKMLELKEQKIEMLKLEIETLDQAEQESARQIERLGEQHGKTLRNLEIERDEWRLIASEEARHRLHIQHDFRVSNHRWQDEEGPADEKEPMTVTSGSRHAGSSKS